jgi:hypothetical protein
MNRIVITILLGSMLLGCQSTGSFDKDQVAQQFCQCQKPFAKQAASFLSRAPGQMNIAQIDSLLEQMDTLVDEADACMAQALEEQESKANDEILTMVNDLMANRYCPETVQVLDQLSNLGK